MSILQRPDPRFWCITKAVLVWFCLWVVAHLAHPGQHPVGAVGDSWQTRSCSEALALNQGGTMTQVTEPGDGAFVWRLL